MALLSAPDRKVMEEAQQRGSDLCGRVNMPPLFMQSQAGAGGRRGDPSQRAMSEPLEWPRPGQQPRLVARRGKTSVKMCFFLFFSLLSHTLVCFGLGLVGEHLHSPPPLFLFPLKNS